MIPSCELEPGGENFDAPGRLVWRPLHIGSLHYTMEQIDIILKSMLTLYDIQYRHKAGTYRPTPNTSSNER